MAVAGSEELLAWATIEMTNSTRVSVANLVLTASPARYRTWLLVEMEASPMIPAEASDTEGGMYNVFGGKAVVARNWIALAQQRAMKGAMSSVVYNERPLSLPSVLDECLEVFIGDAAVEPEALAPRGKRR